MISEGIVKMNLRRQELRRVGKEIQPAERMTYLEKSPPRWLWPEDRLMAVRSRNRSRSTLVFAVVLREQSARGNLQRKVERMNERQNERGGHD